MRAAKGEQIKPGGGAGPIRNIYGRRPGRGLRPYLIVLKVLSVACFLGGSAAVLAVLLASPPADLEGWRHRGGSVERVYRAVIIPGLGSALVFGTVLFASIWRAMLRMRWFITKMVLIVVAVPALHVYASSRMLALESLLAQPSPDLQQALRLCNQMAIGTLAAIVFAVASIVLGRVKPRLGQDYGRTFARRTLK